MDASTGRSWLSSLSKEEFKLLMGELAGELVPILTMHYTSYLTDKLAEQITRRVSDDPAFQRRVVTAVLLLAAAQIQEDKTAPPVTWTCRCGAVNGVNLEKCRVCGRREGEVDAPAQA